ncbi:MAG: MEKHLA domain-containing protein [Chloroflexi bacterium]|nr:MEKHLA domain-containing protein [Chloroflexota bacterium]
MIEPNPENDYLKEHAELLISSYRRLTGKMLVRPKQDEDIYRALFAAPHGVVSHNTDDIPIFNYGNLTALRLFAMSWAEFTNLPSHKSAEAVNRAERERLLARVNKDGFVDGYRGVRISATGKRFWIEETTIWNLVDENGLYYGQAAVFYKWSEL